MTACAMAAMPPVRTLSMRAFQLSGGPMRAAVLASTSRRTRRGAWTPSHMPVSRPATDRRSARARCPGHRAGRRRRGRAARSCTDPASRSRSHARGCRSAGRGKARECVDLGSHIERSVPSELESTRTGAATAPSSGSESGRHPRRRRMTTIPAPPRHARPALLSACRQRAVDEMRRGAGVVAGIEQAFEIRGRQVRPHVGIRVEDGKQRYAVFVAGRHARSTSSCACCLPR